MRTIWTEMYLSLHILHGCPSSNVASWTKTLNWTTCSAAPGAFSVLSTIVHEVRHGINWNEPRGRDHPSSIDSSYTDVTLGWSCSVELTALVLVICVMFGWRRWSLPMDEMSSPGDLRQRLHGYRGSKHVHNSRHAHLYTQYILNVDYNCRSATIRGSEEVNCVDMNEL